MYIQKQLLHKFIIKIDIDLAIYNFCRIHNQDIYKSNFCRIHNQDIYRPRYLKTTKTLSKLHYESMKIVAPRVQ